MKIFISLYIQWICYAVKCFCLPCRQVDIVTIMVLIYSATRFITLSARDEKRAMYKKNKENYIFKFN